MKVYLHLFLMTIVGKFLWFQNPSVPLEVNGKKHFPDGFKNSDLKWPKMNDLGSERRISQGIQC